jgi:hypothetical protein
MQVFSVAPSVQSFLDLKNNYGNINKWLNKLFLWNKSMNWITLLFDSIDPEFLSVISPKYQVLSSPWNLHSISRSISCWYPEVTSTLEGGWVNGTSWGLEVADINHILIIICYQNQVLVDGHLQFILKGARKNTEIPCERKKWNIYNLSEIIVSKNLNYFFKFWKRKIPNNIKFSVNFFFKIII